MKAFNVPLSLLRATVQILILFSPIFLWAQPWGNDFLNPSGTNFGTIRKNADVYFQKAGTAKGSGFKQYKRWEYYWKYRVGKDGTFPPANVRQIEMGKYKPALKGVLQAQGANWTSLGPNSSSGGYGGVGRINRVAFHPSDDNTFYACTAGGGLWKTSNGGSSWTTLTGNLSRIGTSDLVIDPATPDIMYLATGDCDGFDTPSLGVFKSTDGGSTWNATGLSFASTQSVVIFKLIMHPTNYNILLAATNAGIYRSTDAGANWTRVFSSAICYDLEKKPGDANTIYAGTGSYPNCQIYTSADAGLTWTVRTTISSARRIALAVSPANANFVGALVAKSSDNGFLGFYGSTDSGVTWASRSTSPNLLGWNPTGNDSGGQGWYDLCLTIDPANANNIYVGGVNTWKSTNGGTSWAINTMWYGTGSIPEVHADKHDIAFQNNSTLFQCNDGGIYKSTNAGSSWTDLTNGMSISQMYKIGVSQTDTKVIAGLQDNGTKLKSTSNTWSDEIGGDGMDCAIDPSNSNIMYGELYYGDIYRSTNGGSGWSAIAPDIGFEGAGWVTPYALAPSAPATIYIGYENLYKSTNNGTSWTKMTNGQTGGYLISNIAVAPSDANVVYFSSDQYLNSGGNFYKTTNGGSTITTLTKPNSSGYINGIAIDNTNPNNVWVCMAGYSAGLKVYKSTDGGSTWTNVSGTLPNLPANCLAYANGSNGALYLGMDVGVYYIDNTLSDWVPFNTGLPNAEVFDLEIQYSTSTIKAGTYGRGLWESPLYVGPDSTLTLSTTSQTPSSSAGSFSITVASNVDWSASSDADWLTVSPTSGSSNGTVTATYTENTTGVARTGSITFTAGSLTQTITVTQAIPVEISVTPTTQSVSPPAGNFAIDLSSNTAWTLSSNAAWLTASPTSGPGNASVTANYTTNSGAARTGILTFSAGGTTRTVTVTQATPALAVSPTTQAVSAAAGNFAITLTANVNWTVSSNAAWLTASPTSGSNNGSITASYTANTGAARTGTLTFSGGGINRTVTVTQTVPSLTVSPTTSSATAAAGSFAITVTSSINWAVSSNAAWLTASTDSGSGNATVTANYTGNTGALRTGVLTFTGNGITRTVTVTQAAPTLTVSPTTQTRMPSAGNFVITLTSNVAWTVSSDADWLTVTPTSGSNNGSLTASYTANPDAARTGILTFTGGGLTRTVTVTQAAPTLSVTPTTQSRTSAAGSFTTTLTSNLAWTVVSDAVWLTTTVSSGTNNATVTANYTANTGEARTGILTFTGGGVTRTVTVTQATPPVLTVSPTSQAFSAAAGNFQVAITANNAWTVTSNAAWLTATPTSGTNDGSVTANYTVNTGSARTGVLTFSGGGLTRTVTVSQAAPNMSVSPSTNPVSPLAGSVTITLTSNINWTVSSNAAWLTASTTSGSNNGSITASYTANTGAARTGTLTFSGAGINRTVTVTQAAPALTLNPTSSTRTAAEGSFAITLTSNISWSVSSNAAWLTPSLTSGTGNATVTANYSGNTGSARTGTLTFTGSGITRTVTVTQAAPALAVTPATRSVTTAAGNFTTTLTSNVAWTVSSNVPWLTTTTSSGTNNASVVANYTANLTAVRVGILTFTGGGLTRTVTVNQAGLPAYLIVSPLIKSVVATADTFQFSVVANIPWTLRNSGTWLMPGIAGGTNDGAGFAYFQQNKASLMRTDTVYVSGLGITRKIVVTQDEGSAAGATLEVETNAIDADATAAMVSDSISSNGCWTISESASWIMSGVSEGSGNAKITLFLQPNTSGTSRSAVVTVSTNGISRSITITQGAATSSKSSAATLDEFVKELAYTTKSDARIPRIELYPNPAQNMVNLVFDALDTKDQSPRLVVFDGMGRIVVQKENTSNLQQLDVSNFATGMYIFNFYLSDNKIINKKLIINRN